MIVAASAAAGAISGAVAASLVWWHLWRSHAEAHHWDRWQVSAARDRDLYDANQRLTRMMRRWALRRTP